MEATCVRTCYDSSRGRLYDAGKVYEVDESTSFAQDNFDIPKKAKEKGKEKDKE